MKIFAGTSNKPLAEKISNMTDYLLGDLTVEKFSDGEILPKFTRTVRDQDIFIVQSPNTSDDIMETFLIMDAAKRAGVKTITLVAPYLPYSRQDKTDHLRSSIGSKVLADLLTKSGMDRLITIDLHSSSIQGFYDVPVIHLNGNKIFTDYIKALNLENLTFVSPDAGAIKKVTDFAKAFPDSTFALINKKRVKPNEIHSMELLGDVTDKNVVIVDDMADTLGTVKKAADLIMESGARSVRAITTHGVLSGKAIENLESSKLSELIVSDTINHGKKSVKLTTISCSSFILKAIESILNRKSIHEINS